MRLHTLWPRNYFPALHLKNWHLGNEGAQHARSCTQHRASRRYFAFVHEGGFAWNGPRKKPHFCEGRKNGPPKMKEALLARTATGLANAIPQRQLKTAVICRRGLGPRRQHRRRRGLGYLGRRLRRRRDGGCRQGAGPFLRRSGCLLASGR